MNFTTFLMGTMLGKDTTTSMVASMMPKTTGMLVLLMGGNLFGTSGSSFANTSTSGSTSLSTNALLPIMLLGGLGGNKRRRSSRPRSQTVYVRGGGYGRRRY